MAHLGFGPCRLSRNDILASKSRVPSVSLLDIGTRTCQTSEFLRVSTSWRNEADPSATRNDQLEQRLLNTRQHSQLDARINYLDERLTRIETSADAYSQSTETYVAANWTYEDESTIAKNWTRYISGARSFLANASIKSSGKPRANTIVPVTHPVRPDLAINPNLADLLGDQVSPLDPWTRHPDHAASGSQTMSVLRSPIEMLSPTFQPDGFLKGDEEPEGQFRRAEDASRSDHTSISNDPFRDSTSSRTHPSIDRASSIATSTEKIPQGSNKIVRQLSGQTQKFIASRFSAIRRKSAADDPETAALEAIDLLESYIPTSSTIPHLSEIKNNLMNSGGLGLAGTGHGYAPLHFFISLPTECAFEVSLLVEDGVDVNASLLTQARDSRSQIPCHTALQLAAERGHVKIAALLASAPDIDLELADSRGLTPLLIAWRKGHLDVVEVLLHHGAISTGSPNVWQGNSLLHGAAWLCNTELVRLLLALGADVNARNAAGSTPLIAAVISTDIEDARLRNNKAANCIPVMRLLLKAGAKFRLRNDAGHTAMYYAERERNAEAVALLEGKGAKRAIPEAHPLHPHDVVVNLVKRVLTSPTKPQVSDIRRSRTLST